MRRFVTHRVGMPVWLLVLSLLLAAGLGAAGGAGSEDEETEKQLVAETARADAAEATARSKLEAEYAGRERDLTTQAAQLDAREKAVTGAEAAAEANEFSDGVHEVGVDIQPGKYKTQGGPTCYWEKTSKSGAIIDNELGEGPKTVIIEASVFTFTSKNCGTWQKTG